MLNYINQFLARYYPVVAQECSISGRQQTLRKKNQNSFSIALLIYQASSSQSAVPRQAAPLEHMLEIQILQPYSRLIRI